MKNIKYGENSITQTQPKLKLSLLRQFAKSLPLAQTIH